MIFETRILHVFSVFLFLFCFCLLFSVYLDSNYCINFGHFTQEKEHSFVLQLILNILLDIYFEIAKKISAAQMVILGCDCN